MRWFKDKKESILSEEGTLGWKDAGEGEKLLQDHVDMVQQLVSVGSFIYDHREKKGFFTMGVQHILEEDNKEGLEDLDFLVPYLKEKERTTYKAFMNQTEGATREETFKIYLRDGQRKYVKITLRHRLGEDLVKTYGVIQDLTKELEREKRLSAMSLALVRAQKVAEIGSFQYDVVKNLFYGTDEYFRLLGLDPGKVQQDFQKVLEKIHEKDQEKVQAKMQRHKEGEKGTMDFRTLGADGALRYYRSKAEPIFNDQDEVVAIVGTIEDITEIRQLQKDLEKSARLLDKSEAMAHVGSWESDFKKNKTYWSKEAYRIFGLPEDTKSMSRDHLMEYILEEDRHLLKEVLEAPRKEPIELVFRIRKADGRIRTIYELFEFEWNEEENPIKAHGIMQDITEKKEMEAALKKQSTEMQLMESRFQTLLGESSDVFEIISEEGEILYISESLEKVTGYVPRERLGKILFTFYEEEESVKLQQMVKEVLEKPQKKVREDVVAKKKDGKKVYLEFSMDNQLENPSIQGIIVHLRDISSRMKNEQRVLHLSTHDMATGLPNKRLFEKTYQGLKTQNDFSLFLMDIDSSRNIKNGLGYRVVEDYFKQIAFLLKTYCGQEKKLYRYSDNRFIVILEGEHPRAHHQEMTKDILGLFKDGISVGNYELDVDVSLGISMYRRAEEQLEEPLRQAETALYMAKKQGRNAVEFYSKDVDIESYKQFMLRKDLKKAIDKEELKVFYQPMVNLRSQDIVACEALLRWEHKEWGMISPKEFLAMAEETGFIIKIGHFIMEEVCMHYRNWMDKGLAPIKVSINYSSVQFFQGDHVESILTMMEKYQLDPHFLILEISEEVFTEELPKVLQDLKTLQSHGVEIAVDNFGLGNATLNFLKDLEVDYLKLDGSFLEDLHHEEKTAIITKNLIRMIQELRIKMVAKKIEVREQLDFLKDHRVFVGQGFLYSKPLPYEDFVVLLEAKKCFPKMAKEERPEKERRKYFRVKFTHLLEGEVTIQAIQGEKVQVGNTKMLIKNMGPGGLCFISNIRMPIEKDIQLQFKTHLLEEEIVVSGHVVWSEEISSSILEYGVSFDVDEEKRTDLVRILNRVQIGLRNNVLFSEGSFVSDTPFTYFKDHM